MPKRAKGRQYPVEVSAVAWIDLLGYGSMLRSVGFDPSHEVAQVAVSRLRDFQIAASAHATRHVRALIVNDGVVVRKNCIGHKFAASTFERKGIISHHPSNRSQIRSFPATDRGAPDIDTRRESLLPFRASQCRQTAPAVR